MFVLDLDLDMGDLDLDLVDLDLDIDDMDCNLTERVRDLFLVFNDGFDRELKLRMVFIKSFCRPIDSIE